MPFTTVYDEFLAELVKGAIFTGTVTVDLVKSDYTPNRAHSIADMTLADYAGYLQQPWIVTPFTVVGHRVNWAPAVITFPLPTAAGPFNIYAFVVRAQFNIGGAPIKVVQAARFEDAPIALGSGGVPLTFTTFLRWFDAHLA